MARKDSSHLSRRRKGTDIETASPEDFSGISDDEKGNHRKRRPRILWLCFIAISIGLGCLILLPKLRSKKSIQRARTSSSPVPLVWETPDFAETCPWTTTAENQETNPQQCTIFIRLKSTEHEGMIMTKFLTSFPCLLVLEMASELSGKLWHLSSETQVHN